MLRSRLIARCAAIVAIGAASTLQAAVSQPIRIPDFRESPAIATLPQGPCDDCAVVRSIREIHKRREPALARTAALGATGYNDRDRVVGAVIVIMPFGPGSSETGPYVGAVGTPEVQERLGELSYEVTVQMTDGTMKTYERREGRQYNVGDRVRVSDARWELLAP